MLACISDLCNYITKSPKHLDDYNWTNHKETSMNTQISNKLVALGVALVMNSLLLGGVAYMFNSQAHQHTTMVSLAHTGVGATTGTI